MQKCPKLLETLDFGGIVSQDAQSALLADLIVLYGECALRHDSLVDYVEQEP